MGELNTNILVLTERQSDSLLSVGSSREGGGRYWARQNLAVPLRRRQIVMQSLDLARSSWRLITLSSVSNRMRAGGERGTGWLAAWGLGRGPVTGTQGHRHYVVRFLYS